MFKKGDIVKGGLWIGVVTDVFTSAETGRTAIEVSFVKNAYLGQRPEIHPLDQVESTMRIATREELAAEIAKYQREAAERAAALLASHNARP